MFREIQNPKNGLWEITTNGPPEFTSVNDRLDLERLFARSARYALLVCVHPWSNYSRHTLLALPALSGSFSGEGIVIGLHSLENFPQLDQIHPELTRQLIASGQEPALYLFENRNLNRAWFGKDALDEFKSWVASQHSGRANAEPGAAADGGGT
jgi:hypothetical protein